MGFRIHKKDGSEGTSSIQIHEKLAGNVKNAFEDIFVKQPNFRIENLGGYCYRPMNNDTENAITDKSKRQLSNHSWGAALDINYGSDNGYKMVTSAEGVVGSRMNPYWTGMKNLSTTQREAKFKEMAKYNSDYTLRTPDHPVVQILKEHGFGWGGYYGDFMHFSFLDGH